MKKNLFLLKDLLGLSSTNKWLQYQKMCTLLNRAINSINANTHIITMKPIDVKSSSYIDFHVGQKKKILNLKLVIKNIKTLKYIC